MTTLLVGYDGSPASAAAIDAAARLFPGADATLVYLWTPPFADDEVRARLARRAKTLDELIELVECEGGAEAERLAADGAALARAAGWHVEPMVSRSYGGEGYELARLAGERGPDVVVVGSRGLGGVRAMLGSTSDLVVHVSTVPVVVVPHPLLVEEREAAASGPVVIGYDGSAGARGALATAASLFPDRSLVVVTASAVDADVVEHGTLALVGAERADVVVLEADRGGERGVANALVRCAAERQAGVVVVGSRGRSAARKILLGSVAMGVLHHAQRPVLVVPAERFE